MFLRELGESHSKENVKYIRDLLNNHFEQRLISAKFKVRYRVVTESWVNWKLYDVYVTHEGFPIDWVLVKELKEITHSILNRV